MMVSDNVIKRVVSAAKPLVGKTAVIGLSGGADSICLTHILKNAGFSIVCAHVNHCLRGVEADGDEDFVKAFCLKHGIKLFTLKSDVAGLAAKHGTSCEDEGRRIRYEFFENIDIDNKITVTAHNKNDDVETVLLHLIRGSGGLKGIPRRNDVIRPLAEVSRTEIEQYCRENGLDYRTDSSNLTEEYTRNKIRLKVIPEIEKINPGFADTLLRAAAISAEEHRFVSAEAEKIPIEEKYGRYFAENRHYDRAVLMQLIRRMYKCAYGSDKNLGYAAVLAAAKLAEEGKTGKRADLYGGIFLETQYKYFSVGKEYNVPKFRVKLEENLKISEIGMEINCNFGIGKGYVFDADKLGEMYVRNRENGDRCEFSGHTKKLKDILIDQKIPKGERLTVAVLESDGKCACVFGFGINKEFAPDENTVNFITIDWRKYDE